LDADKDVTPQLIFLSGLSCARAEHTQPSEPANNTTNHTLPTNVLCMIHCLPFLLSLLAQCIE
jgi:hypothetical protein